MVRQPHLGITQCGVIGISLEINTYCTAIPLVSISYHSIYAAWSLQTCDIGDSIQETWWAPLLASQTTMHADDS